MRRGGQPRETPRQDRQEESVRDELERRARARLAQAGIACDAAREGMEIELRARLPAPGDPLPAGAR